MASDPLANQLDRLSRHDFQRLAQFIQEYSGIKMPPTKKTMVEGRLRRRVGAVGAANLTDYCRYVFDGGGLDAETIHLIDAVTTNKTEFFREPDHFQFLAEVAVPTLLSERRTGNTTPIKVWSVASSIGAEPYTLAMVLADLSASVGGMPFSILATDLSSKVLKTAFKGIYPEDMISPVPLGMRQRYLRRGKGESRGLVRVAPALRHLVKFERLNLMEFPYDVDRNMDVLFCRNILIYFDKPTQQTVLEQLCEHLRPGGYLFLGHSESLAGTGLPVAQAAATVFRRLPVPHDQ